jgi:cyclopropane-fatty-acyl-phospholipid synthase
MPSTDLLLYFQRALALEEHWVVSGTHYEKTCNAWLKKMDAHKATVLELLGDVYGKEQAFKRYIDWRLFFLACAELFGYNKGQEWFVSHYRFQKQ